MRKARASLVAGATTLGIAGGLFALGWLAVANPPPGVGTNDSGAVQGLAAAGLAGVVALISSCLLFPFVASRLESKGKFSTKSWSRWVMLGLLLVSIAISACALLAAGFPVTAVGSIIALAVLVFCMAVFLLVPASYVWLWVARAT